MPKLSAAYAYIETHQDGCNLHPVCLTCPFEHCQFDEDGSFYYESIQQRNAELRTLHGRLTSEEAAARFGISTSTVWHIWKGRGR